jgi:hypothetical protein
MAANSNGGVEHAADLHKVCASVAHWFFTTYMIHEYGHDTMILTGENKELGEKPVPVPLCPP